MFMSNSQFGPYRNDDNVYTLINKGCVNIPRHIILTALGNLHGESSRALTFPSMRRVV